MAKNFSVILYTIITYTYPDHNYDAKWLFFRLQVLTYVLDEFFFLKLFIFTQRDEDFLTEVHHVNGDGEDAGVVYSEMQGVENKASNIIYFDLIKQVYPGNSSYTVQTGGKLKDLRESTTIEKVRAYHKKYYRPDNMFLTITGNVEPQNLFAALEPIEQKILEHIDEYPDFERPFTVSTQLCINQGLSEDGQ